MSVNIIKVIAAVSKEISRRFDARADLINSVNRQYDTARTAWGANSGSSLEIKRPQKLMAVESATLGIQDVTEETTTLNINERVHVGLGFTSQAMTQDLLNPDNMKLFGDDYLDSAIDNIIVTMESKLHTFIKNNTANMVGTPGTGPNYQTVTQARARLNNNRAGRNRRCFLLNPDDAALLNNSQSGLFNPGDVIGSNYKDGALSISNGFAFKESPDIGNHTNGAGASYVINGAGQTGSSIAIDTGTGNITKGTKVTFPNCFEVDPISGNSRSYLKQFVVTADLSGAGNLQISPSIVLTGALKSASASPTDGGAVVISGAASLTYSTGIAMHQDAYVFGTAELKDIGVKYEVPIITGGAGDGYSKDMGAKKGVHLKLTMDGDITNYRSVARLDALYGIGDLVPEWSTIVAGS